MDVKRYQSNRGEDIIYSYIDGLPDENERVDGYHVIKCMQENKWIEIKTRYWQSGISEAYFGKDKRLFYKKKGNTVYILHACKKQKNKTENNDRDLVLKRAKEIK